MTTEPLAASIAAGAEALGQDLSAAEISKLVTLLSELQRWGERVNLTGIREPRKMVSAHVLDSLAVRSFIEGQSIIDVGTGAGFPGLPLAIVEPKIEFELLDSNGKKISFVNHIIGQLGISNAKALKARAEDYAPGKRFDTVIARALASTAKLLQMAGHLVREDGVLLALKGKYPAEELAAIEHLPGWEYSVTELTVPGLESHARHVIRLRKIAA
ncbi:MAG: 16S rRNA (guanine(527)-N(7))-methyltransferase RsmG [Gammaproteobacteria bacterium]|nr:MAG: 16S rRNA (guanine(527)-N(7))-methyltransferase RsmG [Gammaproteobacteria bacterium]